MNIWHRHLVKETWLVGAKGRLDQGLIPELESTLLDLIQADHYHLLVDLAAVEYINSGGLRCLVTAWRQARAKGGELALCGLNPRLTDIITMVGFDKVFQIYASQEQAEKLLQAT